MNVISDAKIQTDVMNELKWEPRVSHEEIGVAVHDGVVTLSGNVPNYAQKLAAERAAMRVRGVKGIAEEIEVRISGPHKKNDTEIAEAVVHALTWHVWTPENVKAKVQKGWVTLTGEVQFDYQRQSASNAVRFLEGVMGVTNSIKVKRLRMQTRSRRTSKKHCGATRNWKQKMSGSIPATAKSCFPATFIRTSKSRLREVLHGVRQA